MPPDCVVKFQPVDIAKLLLWQLIRASDVYAWNIKARAALTYEPPLSTTKSSMQAEPAPPRMKTGRNGIFVGMRWCCGKRAFAFPIHPFWGRRREHDNGYQ